VSGSRADSATHEATARLTRWIEPVVVAAGFDLDELVVRQAGQRSVLRVVIDSDDGVSLDAIAEVSHAVSDLLDAREGDLGRAPFVLEVTSRGVDRPLTEPRHWRRNHGRLVVVEAGPGTGGKPLTGRIVASDGAGVTLDVQRGGGKGRVAKSAGQQTFTWAQLGTGRVQVEFSRPAGHRDAGLVVEESDEPEHDEHDDEWDDEAVADDDADVPDAGPPARTAHTTGAAQPRAHRTPEDDGAAGRRDDATGGAGSPAADRRRAPRAGRPPRGGRQ
jgi:ribosome maturation factor RimP